MQDGQQSNEPGTVLRPGDSVSEGDMLPQVASPLPPQLAETPQAPGPQPAGKPQDMPAEPQDKPAGPGGAHIEWTASEYIANPKGAGWFSLLAAGSFALAVIVFLVSRDYIATAVIAILGIIVAIFAARQPQVLNYRIDSSGLHIGNKFYPYNGFKAFSVAHEHAIGFIQLLPLKRFMPPLVIHYAPEDEDRIAEVLASYLPYEEHKADVVDALTRKLRF